MKKAAKDLKLGEIIIFDNKLMKVDKQPTLVKPGKGGAFAQVTLRNIKKNTTIDERFKTDDLIEKAYLSKVKVQFLYFDGTDYIFLNKETFDQYQVNQDIISESDRIFLFKELDLELVLFEEEVISIELPIKMVLQVIKKDPSVKNAQQNPSYKKATLENEIETKIPGYINEGEFIVIKTEDRSFVSRHQQNK